MKHILLSSALALVAGTALANDFKPSMQSYLNSQIMPWAQDATIVAAIRAQNAVTQGYSNDRIDQMDKAWRAEVGTPDTPTITPVMTNAAADFLRDRVTASGGAITEVFIMDAHGLNVAASAVTSDYWQGDEAKFQETFPKGAGAVHFSEIELDESTQTYQGQISIAITDPATGDVIGAMTIGVNAEALM